MTSTRRRARASTRAALSPAGPAPTTMASNALPLNRDTHHGSPFRPGPVVVPDRRVAEQLVEHEPGVRTALPDPAVRDNGEIGREALALVEAAQQLLRKEGARFRVDGFGPGDVPRSRDVPGLLRLLLGKVGRRKQLAAVLLGRAHVDQAKAGFTDDIGLDIATQR